jgi:hypothetical protein
MGTGYVHAPAARVTPTRYKSRGIYFVQIRRKEMTKKNKGLLGLMISILIFSACSKSNPFTEEFFEETTYSIDQFNYQEDKISVGTVYNFQISNSDKSYVEKSISLHSRYQ